MDTTCCCPQCQGLDEAPGWDESDDDAAELEAEAFWAWAFEQAESAAA